MPDVTEQIDEVSRQAQAELHSVAKADDLEQFRIKYLGSKGRVKNLMTLLGQVPKEQKPAVGQRVNALKDELTAAFEAKKTTLSAAAPAGPVEDVTEPGRRPPIGIRHILMMVIDELTELFGRMGFSVAS